MSNQLKALSITFTLLKTVDDTNSLARRLPVCELQSCAKYRQFYPF